MIKSTTNNIVINTILIILLIFLSGSAAFFSYQIGLLIIVPGLLFLYRALKIPIRDLLILLIITILIFAQSILHTGGLKFNISIVQISNILTIYFISRLIATDFSFLFRKIIMFISIVSLIFWTGLQFSESFKLDLIDFAKGLPQFSSDAKLELIKPDTFYHFYIFVVQTGDIQRNPGLFYEPGRFAIFICLALAINLFRNKKRFFDFEDLIYITTLITTFSTTGYYILILLISTKFLLFYKKPIYIFLGIFIVPLIFIYLNNLDFMWDKVSADFANAESYSRFAAIGYHFELIKNFPLTGWGAYLKEIQLSPNGFTFLIVRWGLIFSLFYYVALYKGVPVILSSFLVKPKVKTIIFITLLLLTFSQTITTDPIYISIMFFGASKAKIALLN